MVAMIQENADFFEKLTACFGKIDEFEAKIREIAEIAGIALAEFEIDHLAVRMNEAETAEAWKAMLLGNISPFEKGEQKGICRNIPISDEVPPSPSLLKGGMMATLLKESLVNGRSIALLTFHQPLPFCGQAVSVLELPFPKGKTYPVEGWEHIEIVVPMLDGETVEQWIERCDKRWALSENPQIKLKISEPKVSGERLPNPSIAISLADKTLQNHCTIKLHPHSIEKICKES